MVEEERENCLEIYATLWFSKNGKHPEISACILFLFIRRYNKKLRAFFPIRTVCDMAVKWLQWIGSIGLISTEPLFCSGFRQSPSLAHRSSTLYHYIPNKFLCLWSMCMSVTQVSKRCVIELLIIHANFYYCQACIMTGHKRQHTLLISISVCFFSFLSWWNQKRKSEKSLTPCLY